MPNFANIIKHAAQYAQKVMAPLTDPDNGGTFTLGGTDYVGTFYEINASDPLDPTGIRNLRELTIYAERSQFAAAPSASPRVTVTAKGRTWTLQSTTTYPNHYRLTLRPV